MYYIIKIRTFILINQTFFVKFFNCLLFNSFGQK